MHHKELMVCLKVILCERIETFIVFEAYFFYLLTQYACYTMFIKCVQGTQLLNIIIMSGHLSDENVFCSSCCIDPMFILFQLKKKKRKRKKTLFQQQPKIKLSLMIQQSPMNHKELMVRLKVIFKEDKGLKASISFKGCIPFI